MKLLAMIVAVITTLACIEHKPTVVPPDRVAPSGPSPLPMRVEKLTTKGNQILAGTKPIILKGFNVEPAHEMRAWRDKDRRFWTIAQAKAIGANVLRIPIDPCSSNVCIKRDSKYISRNLTALVENAASNGLYVILEFHIVRGHKGIRNSLINFWQPLVKKFGRHNNVIFDLMNEATTPYNWHEWRNEIQPVVDYMRTFTDNILLIGGPKWSSWQGADIQPFKGKNLVYAIHVYSDHGNLDQYLRTVKAVPTLFSEWSWGPSYKHQLDKSWGEYAHKWFEKHKVGRLWWVMGTNWCGTNSNHCTHYKNYKPKAVWKWLKTNL